MRLCLYALYIVVSCHEVYASQWTLDTAFIDPYRCVVDTDDYDEQTTQIKALARQEAVHNSTNIASLIAIAVALKYNQQLDIRKLNDALVARYGDIDKSMNLLSVKSSLIQLGYSSDGVRSERPVELLAAQGLLAFAVDDQRVYHLVYINNNKVYLIYGLNHICPVSLHYYIKWYANRTLLILN